MSTYKADWTPLSKNVRVVLPRKGLGGKIMWRKGYHIEAGLKLAAFNMGRFEHFIWGVLSGDTWDIARIGEVKL